MDIMVVYLTHLFQGQIIWQQCPFDISTFPRKLTDLDMLALIEYDTGFIKVIKGPHKNQLFEMFTILVFEVMSCVTMLHFDKCRLN